MDAILIGKQIRLARRQKGMSVEQLAEQIGIEPASLSHIESGNRQTKLSTLVKIADKLEVSLDYLVARETPETSRLILKNFSDELAALTPKQAYLLLDRAAPVIKDLKENTTE